MYKVILMKSAWPNIYGLCRQSCLLFEFPLKAVYQECGIRYFTKGVTDTCNWFCND